MLTRVMWNLLTLPKMTDWLECNYTEEVGRETVEVMQDIFVGLRPDVKPATIRGACSNALFGFSVERGSGRQHLIFTIMGDCACMGVSITGFAAEKDRQSK